MPLLPPLDRHATKPREEGLFPLPGGKAEGSVRGVQGKEGLEAGIKILIFRKPNHDETDWTEDDVPPPRPCCGRRTSSLRRRMMRGVDAPLGGGQTTRRGGGRKKIPAVSERCPQAVSNVPLGGASR